MYMRPVLLNSCAMAATAEEARYRINAPIVASKAVRVVALDAGAAPIVQRVAKHPWTSARFYICAPVARTDGAGSAIDVDLATIDGSATRLSDELIDVDATVMVATGNAGATPASAIGMACTLRGIMTAGLILGTGHEADAAAAALRPYARVLLISKDEHDVFDVLTALRA